MDTLTIGGAILGVVSLAVGPGGVFYFLVKKGLNGSVDAIKRTEQTVSRISKIQNMDHDRLTQAVEQLNAMKNEQKYYNTMVQRNMSALVTLQTRCELFHKQQLDARVGEDGP